MNLIQISSSVIFIIAITLVSSIPNDDLFLPHVVPWHYKLMLTVTFKENVSITADQYTKHRFSDYFDFYMEIKTNINILCSTQNITLHARYPEFTIWAKLIKSDGVIYGVNTFIRNNEKNLIILEFINVLHPGFYTLETVTINTVRDDNTGNFFRTFYKSKDEDAEWFIAIFTQAIEARRLFPCWDEPQLKTTFTVSIKSNRNLTALSNMPIRDYDLSQDNFTWTHFHTTPPMSTYQVAMAVSNFLPIQINANITLWCREYSRQSIKFAERIIKNVTLYLESKLNETRLPKMDHVAIPNFSHDDVSKWGLIIHRETDLIYNEELHPAMRKIEIARLIAFKIAHQWFSNAISPFWWYHFWLHDGLAVLYGEEAVVKTFNNSQIMDLFVVRTQYESLHLDSHFNMNPLQSNNLSDVNSILDFPRYMKVLIVLRMIQNAITDNLFQRSIHTFLYKYMFSSITPYKFWSIQEDLANKYEYPMNISSAYQAWIRNEHYPIITWTEENPLSSYGKLSQIDTFNALGNKSNVWWIYINLLIQPFLPATGKMWLTPQDSFLNLNYRTKNDWIIIDIQQAGYYRAKYETKNWLKIAYYLNSTGYKNISVINRAKIIDDAFYFIMIRRLNVSVFWELTKYLSQVIDYVAWYPMIKVFEYISNIFPFLNDHSFVDNVKGKLRKLVDLPLKTLGFEEYLMEDDLIKCLRQEIVKWACTFNHSECIKTANYELQQFLKNPKEYKILPWWKEWIYCKGLMNADNYTLDNLTNEWIIKLDYKLLSYLVCSPVFTIELLNVLSGSQYHQYNTEHIPIVRSYINILHLIIVKHANNEYILEKMLLCLKSIKSIKIKIIALINIINNIYSLKLFYKIIYYVEYYSFMNKKQVFNIRLKVATRSSQIQNQISYFYNFLNE